MARCRIPQVKVAEALGISQSAVSRRLRGEQPFNIRELSILASLLGVPLEFLVADQSPVRVAQSA